MPVIYQPYNGWYIKHPGCNSRKNSAKSPLFVIPHVDPRIEISEDEDDEFCGEKRQEAASSAFRWFIDEYQQLLTSKISRSIGSLIQKIPEALSHQSLLTLFQIKIGISSSDSMQNRHFVMKSLEKRLRECDLGILFFRITSKNISKFIPSLLRKIAIFNDSKATSEICASEDDEISESYNDSDDAEFSDEEKNHAFVDSNPRPFNGINFSFLVELLSENPRLRRPIIFLVEDPECCDRPLLSSFLRSVTRVHTSPVFAQSLQFSVIFASSSESKSFCEDFLDIETLSFTRIHLIKILEGRSFVNEILDLLIQRSVEDFFTFRLSQSLIDYIRSSFCGFNFSIERLFEFVCLLIRDNFSSCRLSLFWTSMFEEDLEEYQETISRLCKEKKPKKLLDAILSYKKSASDKMKILKILTNLFCDGNLQTRQELPRKIAENFKKKSEQTFLKLTNFPELLPLKDLLFRNKDSSNLAQLTSECLDSIFEKVDGRTDKTFDAFIEKEVFPLWHKRASDIFLKDSDAEIVEDFMKNLSKTKTKNSKINQKTLWTGNLNKFIDSLCLCYRVLETFSNANILVDRMWNKFCSSTGIDDANKFQHFFGISLLTLHYLGIIKTSTTTTIESGQAKYSVKKIHFAMDRDDDEEELMDLPSILEKSFTPSGSDVIPERIETQLENEQMLEAVFYKLKAEKGFQNPETMELFFKLFDVWIGLYRLDKCNSELVELFSIYIPDYPNIGESFKANPFCLKLLQSIAFTRWKQSRFRESLGFFLQIEEIIGESRSASLAENIAHTFSSLGDLDEAEKYFKRSMQILEINNENANRGGLLLGLGLLHERKGDLLNGLKYCTEALNWFTKKYSHMGDSSLTAKAHVSVGRILKEQGNFTEAELHMKEALKLFISTCGDDSPLVGNCSRNLGENYMAIGNSGEALLYFVKSYAIETFKDSTDLTALAEIHYKVIQAFMTEKIKGNLVEVQRIHEIVKRAAQKVRSLSHQDGNCAVLYLFAAEFLAFTGELTQADDLLDIAIPLFTNEKCMDCSSLVTRCEELKKKSNKRKE